MLYGSTLDPARFSWSSSAPDIATVDDEETWPTAPGARVRRVTGVSEGTATITATSQGVTGSMTVTVRDRARLAWSVPVGTGSIEADIAIGANGTIYVGTNDFAAYRSLWYAVSPEGDILWTLDLPLTGHSTPAFGDDGTLYLGSEYPDFETGSLIAVDPSGSVRWMLGLEDIHSAPALGPDGTIYVAGGHHVYAVDPQSEIQWAYEIPDDDFVFSSPAVASDGTIYVGGEDDHLHAVNPDGSPRWTFETGDLIYSSPAIGPNGTIYIGSNDGRLYAVHPDGTEGWSVEVDFTGLASSPSIGPDGTIYLLAGNLFAIDPGGSIRWSYPIGSHGFVPTPILGADGTVYVGSALGVAALDAQGRLLWDSPTANWISATPAIGADGKIIAASGADSGIIHAFVETASTNGGYAGSPWPTARRNRANTGRAGG